jgi:hypothetical protein
MSTMSNAEMRDFLARTARAAIEQDEDGEFIPTLIVEEPDGRMTVMALMGDHPFNTLVAVAPDIIQMQPQSLSLSVDSYILTGHVENVEAVEEMRARYDYSLQAAFEAGEPGVTEALVINYVTKDWADVISMPYERQGDVIVWGEQTDAGGPDVTGRLIDLLRAIVTLEVPR